MNILDVDAQSAIAANMHEDELTVFWFHLYEQAVKIANNREVANSYLTQRLNCVKEQHEKDIERISNALIEEADDRQWCDEYDSFIYKLNANLNVPLKARTKTYKIWKRFIVELSEIVEATADEIKDIASSKDLTDWMDVSDFDEYEDDDYGFEEV